MDEIIKISLYVVICLGVIIRCLFGPFVGPFGGEHEGLFEDASWGGGDLSEFIQPALVFLGNCMVWGGVILYFYLY